MAKTILARPYFDGLQWHRQVGEALDTSKLSEEVVRKLESKGYLVTEQEYRTRVNPEAARIQAQADAVQGELGEVYALFPGVTTIGGLKAAVEALKGGQGDDDDSAELEQVLQANASLKADLDALQKKLKAAPSPEEAQELAEYRSLVGELLPEGLAPAASKALKAKGYVTKGVISRIPRADLDAVSGVGPEALKLLDGWAPYVGPATQTEAPDAGTGRGS